MSAADRERLLHDVAKYVARTATNLQVGQPVPGALASLLLRDLYGREDEPRMSEVFARHARDDADPALTECRAMLAAIDGLEERARAGDDAALSEAAALARALATRLREWATE